MATSSEKLAEQILRDYQQQRESEVGSLERIADALENVERQLYRVGPSLAYAINVMLREDGADLRIGKEPNGDVYICLDISSRVGKNVQGFFEEHASSWSGIPDAIVRLVKAYELTVPLVATPDIPF